jgi:two-component system, NarL family, nitrate/nitrite response regulator NarL
MTVTARENHSPAGTLRALIVDDHVLVSETLVAALAADSGISVDTAKDVDSAMDEIEKNGPYDVVLLDYDVPGMNAMQGLRRLIEANEGRVALFSGVANWKTVECAIEMGASGFFPKTLPLKTLGHAIRFVADGEVYLPADFVRQMHKGEDGGFGLKPRELRVLAFLGQGMQNKEIGRELGLEEVIVKMDVKSICRKLGAQNRTQAVLSAQKFGLL